MSDTGRILHLISPYGNWEPFARVAGHAAALRESGFSSVVAAPGHSRLWELAEAAGVEVVDYTLERSLNPLRWKSLSCLIAQSGAGIVHTHDAASAALLAWTRLLAKVKCVVTTRYDWHEPPGAPEYGNGVDIIACPSHAMADAFKQRGAPETKLRVVYDGANLGTAQHAAGERDVIRASLREQYCPGKEKPLFVVSIAPLDESGGQNEILEAMPDILAVLPQTHLILIGEGPSRPELERAIKITAIGDEVSIVEPDKAFQRLLAGADLYVAAGRNDLSGFMLQAAMMAGCGIAARRDGCYPELVEDGKSGVLFDNDTPGSVKTAMLELLQNRHRREHLGRLAHARASKHFNMTDLAAEMGEVYRAAASKQ